MDPDILFLVARMAKEIGPLYSHHTETQLLMPRMEVTWIDKAKKMGQTLATDGLLRMATKVSIPWNWITSTILCLAFPGLKKKDT